jgi:hypothetical protein
VSTDEQAVAVVAEEGLVAIASILGEFRDGPDEATVAAGVDVGRRRGPVVLDGDGVTRVTVDEGK